MIMIIAAAAENNALGKDNQLLWHLPDDFKRFKQITTGHYIIMGRKTFESLPKTLPNRTHIIITRQAHYHPAETIVVDSIESAIVKVPVSENAYVIGGGEIYDLALPFTEKIELTRVHQNFEADTFFPEIDVMQWRLIKTEYHARDEKHIYDFTFETYIRR